MNIGRAQKAGNQQLDCLVDRDPGLSPFSPTVSLCFADLKRPPAQEKALTYLYNIMNQEIESKVHGACIAIESNGPMQGVEVRLLIVSQ